MDLLCIRCGEPWEEYFVRHEMTQEEQDTFWKGQGCPCCAGQLDWKFAGRAERTEFARMAQRELKNVLGDDIDGLAAMMQDFGLT